MVICPHCAYPYVGEMCVVAERDVTCSRCNWVGSSTRLLIVDDDKIMDPRVFDELYRFLHKEIAPIIGRTLIQLKLVSTEQIPENVHRVGIILQDFTTAGFESLVRGVLKDG